MGSGIKSKNVRDHGICITLRGARYLLIQRLERVGGGGDGVGGWSPLEFLIYCSILPSVGGGAAGGL